MVKCIECKYLIISGYLVEDYGCYCSYKKEHIEITNQCPEGIVEKRG